MREHLMYWKKLDGPPSPSQKESFKYVDSDGIFQFWYWPLLRGFLCEGPNAQWYQADTKLVRP